jgi:hypothetical protein
MTHSARYFKLLFAIAIAAFLLTSCSRSQQATVEAAPPAYHPVPETVVAETPKLPAKINEVEDAVKRVFKEAARIDTARDPSFVAGDFNGDHSQDIAVVIRPTATGLTELNQEFPAWIIKDPFVTQMTAPLHVEQNEVLLAVIHGYGTNDWRDPQATQTFLLKNAVGPGMEVQKEKAFLDANVGKKLPQLQGDMIATVLHGSKGCLYYTGPTYAWYDPKTFKPEPPKRLVHKGFVPTN